MCCTFCAFWPPMSETRLFKRKLDALAEFQTLRERKGQNKHMHAFKEWFWTNFAQLQKQKEVWPLFGDFHFVWKQFHASCQIWQIKWTVKSVKLESEHFYIAYIEQLGQRHDSNNLDYIWSTAMHSHRKQEMLIKVCEDGMTVWCRLFSLMNI